MIARLEPLTLPTYPVGLPEKNPVFFEQRVYQGSSGKVYPVPFIDKVHDEARPVVYQSARLENEFVRLVLLPEIGGRVFSAQDKTNRLAFLEARRALVHQRDDASVELAALYNLTGRPADALALLTSRRFHPWEGGEGAVLRPYTSAHLLLGQAALREGDAATALAHFHHAVDAPENLGEAYHFSQARADVNHWLGRALRALGREREAREHFEASAAETGDFAEMSVTAHGPLSYYRGLSLRALGRKAAATKLFSALHDFATTRLSQPAQIDYFATSLPNLLVFDEDLAARRDAEHHLLLALAAHGLGQTTDARRHLEHVLAFNQADPAAADLRRQLDADTPAPGLSV